MVPLPGRTWSSDLPYRVLVAVAGRQNARQALGRKKLGLLVEDPHFGLVAGRPHQMVFDHANSWAFGQGVALQQPAR